ncbi:pyruvate dehydrogenase complex dihydrolipoamide acetyltransferase component (E2) [Phytophthora pseudosyringae]|uniref:Pyruvate dehydrogenase complex dihydrolipoamide acetyltransferase component (E2) n=1 Tax=Phytophthora pseudosyringae TaxID=221518 RepID=A0A8T1WF18_9STRA|nr:pyruvate dehydrogenase complex dihydrolipoamide acetyltransferase component (E2) [Phytophthora pseudosyringae]
MSSSPSSPEPKLLPWGRLVLLTAQQNASRADHYDLARSKHFAGRVAHRCDILIPRHFISGLHCIIQRVGSDDRGEPIVKIEDQSRYGTWVNGDKVGYRRKASVKNGDRINFTRPGSKDVAEIAYRLEILPSGLTQQNEELHARLSADEMAVSGRTRKRAHEELQYTQSPAKVMRSPPRPRPTKKLRLVANSQQSSQGQESEPVSEPAGDLGSTPATQQSGPDTVPHEPSARAAGKRRRRTDAPAPDSKLAELQKERQQFLNVLAEYAFALSNKNEQLVKGEQELEATRKENMALKKAHEEELKKAEQELKTLREKSEATTKSHEEELAKVKAQAAADQKKALAELRQEHDKLKRTLEDILVDPKAPPQVRTVAELESKIQEMKRRFSAAQDELTLQRQQESQTTPPSKKLVVELERKAQVERQLLQTLQVNAERHRKGAEEMELAQTWVLPQSNLSGSSQSQDSIDAGHLRNNRRISQQSVGSNENSEPSPGDLSLTLDPSDEKTTIGGTSQGRPPRFNVYGACSATADTSISDSSRPTTLSRTQMFRTNKAEDNETKVGQETKEEREDQGDVEDEETKGGK